MATDPKPEAYDADRVRQHTAAIAATRNVTVQQLLKAGRHASLARMRLEPAQWAAWLADVGYSVKEGELLAAAAGRFTINEGADLLSPSGLLALAGAGVPPAAIAEALGRARRGELICHRRAAQIIKRHRPG